MKNDGFTLIEIIIVIVLMGIILPPIITMVIQGVRSSALAELRTVASHVAQGKMEQITRDKMISNSGYENLAAASENVVVNGITYSTLTNVSTIETGVKEVGVTVQAPGISDIQVITWFTNYSTML